ncbi:hypothetical protein BDW22DRAFT_1295654, partial [Trametopsis cervina]
PSPTSLLFARGVIAKLAVWHALRIAVDQGWGGPESATKRTWLASVIVDAFEQEDPQPDVSYVELTLLQVMEDEFDTVLEDGSAEVVAKDIVRLWSDIQSGNENGVQEFERQADGLKGKKVQAEEGADGSDWEDESGDESGDSESDAVPALIEVESKSEKLAPEVDEDGFTMV